MNSKPQLIEIEWPHFAPALQPPAITLTEYESRLHNTQRLLHEAGFTHLVVYGDREHFANLAYLTGFDPRFEEALLIVRQQGTPLLIVGNECEGYLPVSPLYRAGKLRSELFQPFSLINQPRNRSRLIKEIFASEAIDARAKVGCVGWKYFADSEHPNGVHAIELPAYLVDTLRELCGWENVVNATAILMSPRDGLRTICSPAEIAYFEYTNVLASEALKQMMLGLREGMSDFEVLQLAQLNGTPLNCHITFATGDLGFLGLTSPSGQKIRRGAPLSTNIAYWGSNSCRAGWVAASAKDLPADAQDYVENFVGPYFAALAEWFGLMHPGVTGGEVANLIAQRLPLEKFGITLNPGHLIHLDEWVSSPIYPGSHDPIQSGMVMQVDVIPASPRYFSTRMEDGIVIADSALRHSLAANFPDCYARCQQRRNFMQNVLGIALPDEVLPLSNIAGIVPPFLLAASQVMALR
ncbi:MAG: hypothetical protein U0175_05600 [Caldilineaceae bacterium]